jgi:hypothetical protein
MRESARQGRLEERLIFDPDTGRALGMELRAVRARGPYSWLEAGALAAYHLILGFDATDDAPPKVTVAR